MEEDTRYYTVENYDQLSETGPEYMIRDAIMDYEWEQNSEGLHIKWEDLPDAAKIYYLENIQKVVEEAVQNMQKEISGSIPGIIRAMMTYQDFLNADLKKEKKNG